MGIPSVLTCRKSQLTSLLKLVVIIADAVFTELYLRGRQVTMIFFSQGKGELTKHNRDMRNCQSNTIVEMTAD